MSLPNSLQFNYSLTHQNKFWITIPFDELQPWNLQPLLKISLTIFLSSILWLWFIQNSIHSFYSLSIFILWRARPLFLSKMTFQSYLLFLKLPATSIQLMLAGHAFRKKQNGGFGKLTRAKLNGKKSICYENEIKNQKHQSKHVALLKSVNAGSFKSIFCVFSCIHSNPCKFTQFVFCIFSLHEFESTLPSWKKAWYFPQKKCILWKIPQLPAIK